MTLLPEPGGRFRDGGRDEGVNHHVDQVTDWVTGPSPSAPVTIIFQQLSGTYSVDVTCYGTGNSASYSPVVY